MIKTLAKEVKQYKKSSFLSVTFAILEVFTDVTIPVLIAQLIDKGVSVGNMNQILYYGGIMLVMVLIGLLSGIMAGKFAANASTGYAANLRESMFANIQTFSFSNIDFIFKY